MPIYELGSANIHKLLGLDLILVLMITLVCVVSAPLFLYRW